MKIETIVVRDPDGDTSVETFVDGEPASTDNVTEYEIDAGRGYDWSDWCASRDFDLAAASHPKVRAALEEAYDDPPGGKYIDKPEDAGWLDPYVEEAEEAEEEVEEP